MSEPDLQLARLHLASLRRLAGAPQSDPAALRKIGCLCYAAWRALPDEDCGEQLMNIEVHAAELLAGAAHADWRRTRIREALAAFEERLDEIEAGRMAFSDPDPARLASPSARADRTAC
jgi:hypothetical protein